MGSTGATSPFSPTQSGRFTEDITTDEDKAIKTITGGSWKSVNAAEKMNKQLRKLGDAGLTEAGSKIKQSLDSAVSKYDLMQTIKVHRGGSADMIGGYTNIEDIKKLIGKTVQDNGYTSTSTSAEVADSFPGEIKYHIDIPKGSKNVGMYIADYSKHPNEKEFLTGRRNQYIITNVYTQNGKINVNLKYIGKGEYDIAQNHYKQWLDNQ